MLEFVNQSIYITKSFHPQRHVVPKMASHIEK